MNGNLEHLTSVLERIRGEVRKVIIGQDQAVDEALIVIFTRNHALIEGVPGIAKTLLARTLARALGCEFARIQFTPDLMPADITGTNVFDMRHNEFTLVRGPIFTSFLLADEINRAPAKTQSALLQAMQERVVTIDRDTHTLSPDFTVFATQNPIEFEGTYPLPEAQKDRFMLKIVMSWPERDDELALAQRTLGTDSPESILERGEVTACVEAGELDRLRAALNEIVMKDELVKYVVDVIRKTRAHESVLVGAGPRATQALLLASRARAAIQGRDFVTPDDIRNMARAVLEHRLILRPEYEIEGLSVSEVVQKIFEGIAVPR
jgi:MoxR-like ATPase